MYNAYLFLNQATGEAVQVGTDLEYAAALALCETAMEAFAAQSGQPISRLGDSWYTTEGWLPKATIYDAAHDWIEQWQGQGDT